jgi:putative redox protein
MVTIRPKTVVTLRVKGACPSHSRTDVSVRDLKFSIDEPIERGGTNMGPSPTETLMAALAACTNRIGHKVADLNGVDIKEFAVNVEAQFDRRGTQLQEELDVPFPEVQLNIAMTTDADDAAVEKMKADLQRFCPISKVIRQAGTEIIENWTVRRP